MGKSTRALHVQLIRTSLDPSTTLLVSDADMDSFIGLTPGVLVCFAITRWLQSTFGDRRGWEKTQLSSQIVRVIR